MSKHFHPRIDVALTLFRQSRYLDLLASGGFLKPDYDILVGQDIWMPTDRPRIRAVMDHLLFAAMDTLGLPRVQLSAEYIASVIAVFVNPINWHPASYWYANAVTSEQLIDNLHEDDRDDPQFESRLSGESILALVQAYIAQSNEGDLSAVRQRIVSKMSPPSELAEDLS